MKRNLLILGIVTAFLIGCVPGCTGLQVKKDQTTETAVDISASTIGYYVGKNNVDLIPEWNKWLDKVLAFEQGDSVLSYETLLNEGFKLVTDEPYLEMQLKKLIRLLDFPELQPPELPFLTSDYIEMVKIVLGGFRDGLEAALRESQKK